MPLPADVQAGLTYGLRWLGQHGAPEAHLGRILLLLVDQGLVLRLVWLDVPSVRARMMQAGESERDAQESLDRCVEGIGIAKSEHACVLWVSDANENYVMVPVGSPPTKAPGGAK